MESLTGQMCCRQVKFLCLAEGVKDSNLHFSPTFSTAKPESSREVSMQVRRAKPRPSGWRELGNRVSLHPGGFGSALNLSFPLCGRGFATARISLSSSPWREIRAKERGAGRGERETRQSFTMFRIWIWSEARLARVTFFSESVLNESSSCAAQRRPLARRRTTVIVVDTQRPQAAHTPRWSEAQPR